MAEKHTAEIFLKQNVTDSLKGAGAAVVRTRAGLASIGPAAKASFSMAGNAMTMLNQSLEIGKKALETFRATVGASIETSLQFRRAGDETVQYFKDLGRESELVKARLGDALLPVIRGFTEATGAATGSISDWIAANQKLIGQGLVEFLGNTANLLAGGVAAATNVVAQAWHGWAMIVDSVKVAVNAFFSIVMKNAEGLLGGLQRVASAFGADGLAAAISTAKEGVQSLGAEFDRSGEEAKQGLLKTAASLNQVQTTIATMESTVKRVISNGMVKAQQEVAKATTGLKKNIDEQTAALVRQGEVVDAIMQRRIAAIEKEAALREKDARAADAAQQASAGSAAAPMTAGQAGTSLLGSGGDLGGVASAALADGAMAGLAAAGAMVVANSEALQGILAGLTSVVTDLFGVMEPLFEALVPLVDIVGVVAGMVGDALAPLFKSLGKILEPILIALVPITELLLMMTPAFQTLQVVLGALQPILEILGKVMKKVAGFMLSIAEGIAKLWNGIIGAIAGVLKKLGGISVFGKKPLGFLEDWGNDLQRNASISTARFDEARRQLSDSQEETAEAMEDGATAIAESTKEITGSMSNVPGGIKMAYEEFQAATGLGRSTGQTGAPLSVQGVSLRGQERADTQFLGDIYVNGVTDLAGLTAEVSQESQRRLVLTRGALARTQWAIP